MKSRPRRQGESQTKFLLQLRSTKKITEKVNGKLVITKVQKTTKVSTRRKPKAA